MRLKDKAMSAALALSSAVSGAPVLRGQASEPLSTPQTQSQQIPFVPPALSAPDNMPFPSKIPPFSSLTDFSSLPIGPVNNAPSAPLFPLDGLTIRFDWNDLVERIKHAEGKVFYPYKDTVKVTTIGFGYNMDKQEYNTPIVMLGYNGRKPLNPSARYIWQQAHIAEDFDAVRKSVVRRIPKRLTITPESAEALLVVSAQQAIHNAAAYFKYFNDADAERQKALVYLAYNFGEHLERHPDLLSAANADGGPNWSEMGKVLMGLHYHKTYEGRKLILALAPELNVPLPHQHETHHHVTHVHHVTHARNSSTNVR